MTKEEIIKLKEFIGEEEWENFQPDHALSPDISGKLWDGINKNSASPQAQHSYFRSMNFRWMAVAASILLMVGLSWQFFISEKQKTASTIGGGATVASLAKTKRIFNNTLFKMTLLLSDGSKVELLPNSTLSYTEDFNSVKRDVTLTGEANFDIAKDVAKPFSVYSNSVLITVLGTRFTVKSYQVNATKVILHEGRVKVKIPNSSSQDKKEYYLIPGDIFILKKINKQARAVNVARVATPAAVSNDSLWVRILHLEKDKEDSHVFDNCPLDVVFDQLELIYNTKIIYDKADLGNRSFIGEIDKKDSLAHILKSLTLLNNFTLQKQGDSYIITN